MILTKVLERFVSRTPISVMAQATMTHALSSDALDAVFEETAESQYTKQLMFSTVVDVMGLAVCKIAPSVHAALQDVKDSLPVSITAFYDKLNGTEPALTQALVDHTASRLRPVIDMMGGGMTPLLPGCRVRIIDGNHFAVTQRRLKVLHRSIAGPLPGQALVVLDPELMLATQMIPCEDGHAQERSMTQEILGLVQRNDVWIADRNFCTAALLSGVTERKAYYIIRQHAKTAICSEGALRKCGRSDTGDVFEQTVELKDVSGGVMKARRIVIRLRKPTRDGDTEMAILTNLPKSVASALTVVRLYRKRWTVETMFQQLTDMLDGEIDSLAYPRAALLGFAIALAAYNVLSTVLAALRAKFGEKKVTQEVSLYYVANEVRAMLPGLQLVLDPEDWDIYAKMSPQQFADQMLSWASHVRLPKYKRHPRGPKKPVPKRTRYAKKTHVSTARLLAKAAKSRKKAP